MDRLHQILAGVEELCLRNADLTSEAHCEVLHHDAIATRKESKYVLDEVTLIVRECHPIFHILAEVNLFRDPEDRHMLLLLGPDVGVLNGEDDVAVGVLLTERLRGRGGCDCGRCEFKGWNCGCCCGRCGGGGRGLIRTRTLATLEAWTVDRSHLRTLTGTTRSLHPGKTGHFFLPTWVARSRVNF